MPYDDSFRFAVLAVVAATMPVAVYHRWRSITTEPLDRWQEGAWMLFGLRASGIPLFLGVLAWLIEPRWMAWSALPLPVWLRATGVAVLVSAGLLLFWTFRHLGRNLTDTVVTRRDHTLVTSGPYRFVRHPFYMSFALGVLGIGLAAANWFLPAAGAAPLVLLMVRTRTEEAKLIERFGDDYRDYRRRVGRFLPRWGGAPASVEA